MPEKIDFGLFSTKTKDRFSAVKGSESRLPFQWSRGWCSVKPENNSVKHIGKSINSQRGFSILEVLIVMIVLGIMAGVIIPNVTTFSNTANLDAARTEMQNVKTAALGYYGEHQLWPNDSTALSTFLTSGVKATYIFDNNTGIVTGVDNVTWSGICWSAPPGPSPYSQDGMWTK